MYLSVIIPAYNEEKRIGTTLQAVGSWLAGKSFASELIVVNNRSSDATSSVVREHQRQFPFIRLIDEKRPGKGHAVVAGMRFAAGQVRLFMDADNATGIEHFEKAQPLLDQGFDVVIGSLAVPGSVVVSGGGEPLWRVVLGKLGNLWVQLWAVPGIWDTQRGFKVFTAKAAQDIFPRLTIFGWGFDAEVLAVARARGYRIAEIPVTWNNAQGSKVGIGSYLTTLGETVRIGWNRMKGLYRT
jgi:dolichyl-phosphate beta-glucosyltransferase